MIKRFSLVATIVSTFHFSWAIPFKGTEILISAPSPYAVEVGQQVARAGGNVVDVAVAVGLTLAVTSPYFASLGGGGFALVKMDKKVEALDFREMAPQATHKEFYSQKSKEAAITGGSAVGVPGLPAGLWELHKKYGKLKWRALFAEPLKFSKEGFRVSGEWVEYTQEEKNRFDEGGKKHFLKVDKSMYKPGEILKQWFLSRALLAFRDKNLQGFYGGPVAKDIVDSVNRAGGVMTLEDLSNYKVRWLSPMVTQFKNHTIYLMPPPSSGGVVIQSALEIAKRVSVDKQSMYSVEEFHLLGEILSRAFRGRVLLGDPDFHKNPLEHLLGVEHLDSMAKTISLNKTKELGGDEFKIKESTETTHFVVMDKLGNTVSLTETLNGTYGSGVVTTDYGIALNNEMDDFTTRTNEANQFGLFQGSGNLVEPGKRPLSSMSPTIVEKEGETVLALGAPGGPRIISGVFQTLYRVLVSGLNMDQAIQAPRVHHQFRPHRLMVEKNRFTPETVKGLKEKGHQVDYLGGIAKVYGIKRQPGGELEAAYDSRGEGAVGGY
ncbi:MAG: gamma-glutamyltransferase [Pseudomonadota bacterium]|jgi:gamma-glutamyltranspeptidase/glutathione hydrolase